MLPFIFVSGRNNGGLRSLYALYFTASWQSPSREDGRTFENKRNLHFRTEKARIVAIRTCFIVTQTHILNMGYSIWILAEEVST
jgi:hypothetical protein